MTKTLETFGGSQVTFVPELSFAQGDQLQINPILVNGLRVRFQSDFLAVHWLDDIYKPVRLEFEARFHGEFWESDELILPEFEIMGMVAATNRMQRIGKQTIRVIKERDYSPLYYSGVFIGKQLDLKHPPNYLPNLGKVVKGSLHYLLLQ